MVFAFTFDVLLFCEKLPGNLGPFMFPDCVTSVCKKTVNGKYNKIMLEYESWWSVIKLKDKNIDCEF